MPDIPFRSPWWLPEGHSQTLWRRFVSTPAPVRRRQRIELDDGDFIDLDWLEPEGRAAVETPVHGLLLHGLCGSSDSPYILALQRRLLACGLPSVALNFRGCSGEPNRLARAYHSGCTEDLEAAFQALRWQSGVRQVVCVGFSLGGNVLLKWLAEIGEREEVLGAVAVSTPFALTHCSRALNSGLSSLYGHYFRRRLIGELKRKRDYFRPREEFQEQLRRLDELGDLARLRTLWEFDDQVTAPLHGFQGAEDYYERCSSGPRLGDIRQPVSLIQAANDPIIPRESLPQFAGLPQNVRLTLLQDGGHVGFTCAGDPQWLESRILSEIRGMLRDSPTVRIEVG